MDIEAAIRSLNNAEEWAHHLGYSLHQIRFFIEHGMDVETALRGAKANLERIGVRLAWVETDLGLIEMPDFSDEEVT